jgi:hypothetical protein
MVCGMTISGALSNVTVEDVIFFATNKNRSRLGYPVSPEVKLRNRETLLEHEKQMRLTFAGPTWTLRVISLWARKQHPNGHDQLQCQHR